ncbi:transient receptor potential cation channel subfamily M member 3-like, partial [Tubulanus polymorphus]|uniref:transient receptor potential cation channel subfamily M member 3-like n=1 Tax=Tubulanus polymorphus TaxID=672921 RepID=UPI003DA571D9
MASTNGSPGASPVLSRSTSLSSLRLSQKAWVERNFMKRECVHLIPSQRTRDRSNGHHHHHRSYSTIFHERCGCGRDELHHYYLPPQPAQQIPGDKWTVGKHTE